MQITYNKLLNLYESKVLSAKVYGESIQECIKNGVDRLNWYREYNGLSKILV